MDTVDDVEDGIQIAAVVVVVESWGLVAEHKAAQKMQHNRAAAFDPSVNAEHLCCRDFRNAQSKFIISINTTTNQLLLLH